MAGSRRKEIAEIEKKLSRLQSSQSTERSWKTQFLQKPMNELEYLRYKKILLGKICPNDTTEDSSLMISVHKAQTSLKKAKKLTIALEDEPEQLLSTLRKGIDRCSLHLSDLVDLQQTISFSRELEESAQSPRLLNNPRPSKLPLTESMVETLPDYFTNGSVQPERQSAINPIYRDSTRKQAQRSASTERFSRRKSPPKADKAFQKLIESQNKKKRSLEESFTRLMVERGKLINDIQRLEKMKMSLPVNPDVRMDKIIAIFDSEEVSFGDADLTFVQGVFESSKQPQRSHWEYSTCKKTSDTKENEEVDQSLKDTTDLIQSCMRSKKAELPHVRIFEDEF